MIVFYNEKGEINGSLEGNYDTERHNFGNRNYIEVEKQVLAEKKVDTEKKELVKDGGNS